MGNCRLCVNSKQEHLYLLSDNEIPKKLNKDPQSHMIFKKSEIYSHQLLLDAMEKNFSPLPQPENSQDSDTEPKQDENIQSNLDEYEKELKDLVLDCFDMHNNGFLNKQYDHIFQNNISNSQAYQALGEKSQRLNLEIKLLSKQLPVNKTNSIFVRYDEQRMDVMKACIVGADDTPYANGVFIYDAFFDDSYPNNPPKMQLITTGNNTVRFNPNLYQNGYICLSILGTWPGGVEEKWNKERSNFLQILLSIQSMVMSPDVYFNEPGYDGDKHTENGIKYNKAYSNIVKYANIKYAMISQLQKPPKGFEEIIKKHFYYKKKEILQTCFQWLKEAEDDDVTKYTSLVLTHNKILAEKFSKNKKAYYNALKKEIKTLSKLLNELKL